MICHTHDIFALEKYNWNKHCKKRDYQHLSSRSSFKTSKSWSFCCVANSRSFNAFILLLLKIIRVMSDVAVATERGFGYDTPCVHWCLQLFIHNELSAMLSLKLIDFCGQFCSWQLYMYVHESLKRHMAVYWSTHHLLQTTPSVGWPLLSFLWWEAPSPLLLLSFSSVSPSALCVCVPSPPPPPQATWYEVRHHCGDMTRFLFQTDDTRKTTCQLSFMVLN